MTIARRSKVQDSIEAESIKSPQGGNVSAEGLGLGHKRILPKLNILGNRRPSAVGKHGCIQAHVGF
jgi:hypothetical protein